MKYFVYGPSAWKQSLAEIFTKLIFLVENEIKTNLVDFLILLHVTFSKRKDEFAITLKMYLIMC